jgi:hypothetical protein
MSGGRWVRGAGGAALVVVAVALGTAWTAVGESSDPTRASVPALERALAGTITSLDAPDVAGEPVLNAVRTVEPRLGPIWALPGFAAGLAAVCVLRRLRASPAPPAALVLCCAGRSRRGPPLAGLV